MIHSIKSAPKNIIDNLYNNEITILTKENQYKFTVGSIFQQKFKKYTKYFKNVIMTHDVFRNKYQEEKNNTIILCFRKL